MLISNQRLSDDARGLAQLSQKSLPVKISYAIAKNIIQIEGELKVYNKERQKLIDKYSVKDEDGNVKVDDENNIIAQKEFLDDLNRDFKELNEIENEIKIHKFNMSDLINSGMNISPGELMLIDYMIEDQD